eukprot:11512134-Alexandrium_andersonii.AAC.1
MTPEPADADRCLVHGVFARTLLRNTGRARIAPESRSSMTRTPPTRRCHPWRGARVPWRALAWG